MKPALARFLKTLQEKLSERKRAFPKISSIVPPSAMSVSPGLKPVKDAASPSQLVLQELNQLLEQLHTNVSDDKFATEYCDQFLRLRNKWKECPKNDLSPEDQETVTKFFDDLADNEIYILNLLLYQTKEKPEFKISTFMEHFYKFLGCPFNIKNLNNGEMEFILFYNGEETDLGKKQRKNADHFYQALWNLGIVNGPKNPEKNNQFKITISPEHSRDILQLAQFELIDEKNVSKKIEDLTNQFRFILIELIKTEAVVSESAGKVALLLEEKLKQADVLLLKEDREFFETAAKYYREIADDPYPWFGKETTKSSLEGKSFSELLGYCHNLYADLGAGGEKANKLGKRLAMFAWITLNQDKLDRINHKDNILKLTNKKIAKTDEGRAESEKLVAQQYVIAPLQRLPRIILLTNELIKCAEVVMKNNSVEAKNVNYLDELKELYKEWVGLAVELNNKLKKEEDSFLGNIFRSFKLVTMKDAPAKPIAATALAKDILGKFSHFRTSFNTVNTQLFPEKEEVEHDLEISVGFEDDLYKSALFGGVNNYSFCVPPLEYFYHAAVKNIQLMSSSLESDKFLELLTNAEQVEFKAKMKSLNEAVTESFVAIENKENVKESCGRTLTDVNPVYEILCKLENSQGREKANLFVKQIVALKWLLSEEYPMQPITNKEDPEFISELKRRLGILFDIDEDEFDLELKTDGLLSFYYTSLNDEQSQKNLDSISGILHILGIPFTHFTVYRLIAVSSAHVEDICRLAYFSVMPKASLPSNQAQTTQTITSTTTTTTTTPQPTDGPRTDDVVVTANPQQVQSTVVPAPTFPIVTPAPQNPVPSTQTTPITPLPSSTAPVSLISPIAEENRKPNVTTPEKRVHSNSLLVAMLFIATVASVVGGVLLAVLLPELMFLGLGLLAFGFGLGFVGTKLLFKPDLPSDQNFDGAAKRPGVIENVAKEIPAVHRSLLSEVKQTPETRIGNDDLEQQQTSIDVVHTV